MAQKNISMSDELERDFVQFCVENGYPQNAVVAAAFLAFSDVPHEERKPWFKKVAERYPKDRAGGVEKVGRRRSEAAKSKGKSEGA